MKRYFTTIGLGAIIMTLASGPTAAQTPDFSSLELVPVEEFHTMTRGGFSPDDLILNPEGRVELYSMDGMGISTQYDTRPTRIQGATHIFFAEDNKVYLQHPISAITYGFVEGTISDDGKTIHVDLPQNIAAMRYTSADNVETYFPLSASIVYLSSTPEQLEEGLGYYSPIEDPELNYIEYAINEDGTIEMTYPDVELVKDDEGFYEYPETFLSCYLTAPDNIIGIGTTGEEVQAWWQYGNFTQKYSPIPTWWIEYQIPEDLEWSSDWSVVDKNDWAGMVVAAVKDNFLYMKNLSYPVPENVIVFELTENEAILRDGQYLGIGQLNRFLTLRNVDVKMEYNESLGKDMPIYSLNREDMFFDYDPQTKTLTPKGENKGFIVNSLIDEIYYMANFNMPTFRLQTLENLCYSPLKPIVSSWNDYSEWSDGPSFYGVFEFKMTNEGGFVIPMEQMYYRVYINDELFMFYADEYGIDEDMDTLPALLNGSTGKLYGYGDGAQVGFTIDGIDSVGIQTVVKGVDGKEYASEIDTYTTSGIKLIDTTETNAVETVYYDLTGRRIDNPAKGSIVICHTRYADGTIKTSKKVF